MAQVVEGATETVEAVKFGFFTAEEVRKHSLVRLTNAGMLDMVGSRINGGLYDPAMGPLSDREVCKSCGLHSRQCPGHCGHVDLIFPAYNPLLFDLLYTILQGTCLICHHFRASKSEVSQCVTQLKLISKSEIVKAKCVAVASENEGLMSEESDGSAISFYTELSGEDSGSVDNLGRQNWTSYHLKEAMSVLNSFLKKKIKKCRHCHAKNPQVTKPTFGWFHLRALSDKEHRENVHRGCQLKDPVVGQIQEKILSEKEDDNDMFPGGAGVEINEAIPNEDVIAKGHKKSKSNKVDEYLKQKKTLSGPLLPTEVESIMKDLWENEIQLCSFIGSIQRNQFQDNNKDGYSMFFLEAILVPPIKFRPPSKGGDSVMEHPQTVLLGKVISSNMDLMNAHANNSGHESLVQKWMGLQQSINVLFDNKTAKGQGQKETASGICQLLEKKMGIFRQKMMGKRVNFACRSVISPDPYLAVNEIGIPPHFALRLTYPERVTPWNAEKLRKAIINGPAVHPGATHYVENSVPESLLKFNQKQLRARANRLPSSRGASSNSDYNYEGKYVYRHLQNGDIVLVNRQPTLHKSSIMAHKVRVLPGEKTLRMHYANCSAYNADFDGDEMNVHFPQDEISRSEGENIVNADNQYIVPTRGETIRGLIQDHIVSAVLLTKKDTFLNRDEYHQLLYGCGVSTSYQPTFFDKPNQKVHVVTEDELEFAPPAIWKPKPLWTGKQVITALLNHVTKGHARFNVEKEGKIPSEYFGGYLTNEKPVTQEAAKNSSEKEKRKNGENSKNDAPKAKKKKNPLGEESILVLENELVRGVIDKAQFGNYGLVHTVQELYGSSTAGKLLSAFSRLFTLFLQMHGFTCGVDDLLILEQRDKEMQRKLEECRTNGEEVHCAFVNAKYGEIEPVKLQMEVEKAIRSRGDSAVASLDGEMRGKLNTLVNSINKDLFPNGLLKPFPKNCFSLMTTSGAKGGAANLQQVSSLLGQQDLEGKRVPRMASGKTLPCFIPWDCTSRSGGFISNNFLNGLRPQEYYFHCMAGREGLVDTAVKTSRSGYLQRCIIKNLEGLKVCYDHTVRDADGSIIQFQYGEDGVDVHLTSFLMKFRELKENQHVLFEKFDREHSKSNDYIKKLPKLIREEATKFIEVLHNENMEQHTNKEKHKAIAHTDFMDFIKQKYFSSLAQPGEPVGVIAAQSVGEPSTQMTLNTFHLAGRGESNVTLGIPRLQEILMTASINLKTPIMTCPLLKGKSKDDAKALASKLKKVTLADVIESMEVCVVPFSVSDGEISCIYKLRIKLYKPKVFPPHIAITLKDCQTTLKREFLKKLVDAITRHLAMLSRISGIKNAFQSPAESSENDDETESASQQKNTANEDDEVDDEEGAADDLGFDQQKKKRQVTDEVDYEGSGDEQSDSGKSGSAVDDDDADETNPSSEPRVDEGEDEDEDTDMVGDEEDADEIEKETSKISSSECKIKEDDAFTDDMIAFQHGKGSRFEVHFKLIGKPHILLAQIAQTTAGKIDLKNAGQIVECRPVNCADRQVLYFGEDPKKREALTPAVKEKMPALHAAGLDFATFWKMDADLDLRYLYSNNIQAVLRTYGVEAARESIILEIQNVFGLYGIKIDYRHLCLIADFMTFNGEYQPLSRSGRIAESISPFSKMSFETASRFIVEAASMGQTDTLETPSSRICLGMLVKLGTGSFDLLQKFEV
uniref:DNA-directed RNA polymerase subunit n=1 Tax=Kalanchoe fedtschenkoi TaxID=63787 RepID=A0A7N0T457_KALFE